MKIIFITIIITVFAIVGGLAVVSTMDVKVTQENIRKEIAIETPAETSAPTPIPIQ